eukprot:SAG11_NODE_42710_length_176_cov_21.519481_1_plen_31_part_10
MIELTARRRDRTHLASYGDCRSVFRILPDIS